MPRAPDPQPLSLGAPDATFVLSEEVRAMIVPGFDVDALERLLALTRPDMRGTILGYFQKPVPGRPRGELLEIYDPRLQPLLEEVWATRWEEATDRALMENWYGWPGREIALRRREARKDHPSSGEGDR